MSFKPISNYIPPSPNLEPANKRAKTDAGPVPSQKDSTQSLVRANGARAHSIQDLLPPALSSTAARVPLPSPLGFDENSNNARGTFGEFFTKKCPPAPNRRLWARSLDSIEKGPEQQNAFRHVTHWGKKAQQLLKLIDTENFIGRISFLENTYTVEKSFQNTGRYGFAYLVRDQNGIEKVLKFHRNLKGNNDLKSRLKEELKQYIVLKEKNYPVAIYETFESYFSTSLTVETYVDFLLSQGPGFHVVEYIPDKFPDRRDDIPNISETSYPYWTELRNLIAQAHNDRIALDLQKDNIGIKDGKIIYFDLRPEDEETHSIDENPFLIVLNTMLPTFTSKGSALWNWLTEGIRVS